MNTEIPAGHFSPADERQKREIAQLVPKTPLLCRSKVRALALHYAQGRARKFDRVGNEFFVAVEAALRNVIAQRVANHPSVGKTLQ